ncbi:hypothetical protein BN927_01493 [Lactococcus lactis subsp. lactis Dephy 1]|nr:hypothetical protein BN927_01493 [Lactococcus lactis subsp. lactis Dephy 1]
MATTVTESNLLTSFPIAVPFFTQINKKILYNYLKNKSIYFHSLSFYLVLH